jgi:hypothetical protein
MSVLAKLISLEAINVIDPGGDRLTISMNPGDDGIFIAQEGNKFFFEFFTAESLKNGVRIDDQLMVQLNREDLQGGGNDFLGRVFIVAGELGLGERKQQFEGELLGSIGSGTIHGPKFHYELTYEVLPA